MRPAVSDETLRGVTDGLSSFRVAHLRTCRSLVPRPPPRFSCKHLGATVIGTTSTQEKADIAKKAGADHVLLYGEGRDIVSEIYKITGGVRPPPLLAGCALH